MPMVEFIKEVPDVQWIKVGGAHTLINLPLNPHLIPNISSFSTVVLPFSGFISTATCLGVIFFFILTATAV